MLSSGGCFVLFWIILCAWEICEILIRLLSPAQHMKQVLQGRFLLLDYQQILYNQFEYCQQGTRTVTAYTGEFYRLASHCDLVMMEELQAVKYINDLKYTIQKCVILHDVFSIDEAHNKALMIKRLQSWALSFRHPTLIEEITSDA